MPDTTKPKRPATRIRIAALEVEGSASDVSAALEAFLGPPKPVCEHCQGAGCQECDWFGIAQ